MFRQFSRKTIGALVAGLGIGFLSATLFFSHSGSSQAVAQSSRKDGVIVRYSASKLDGLSASADKDYVRQVHPFPGKPVFLMRSPDAISVWERRNNSMVKLMEFLLNDKFEEVVFLDDGKTFVVQTNRGASVFSIDERVIPVEN